MPTPPICHRTLTHADFLVKGMGTGSPCIGSRCALWVGMPGKNGICADNPDRIRDDPAVGDAKEK